MGEPRITLQTHAVLKVFLADIRRDHYGLEIARAAGLPSGTIYPILARLETAGWVTSGWEDIDESNEGRRKRRYYRITGAGYRAASDALERVKRLIMPEWAGARS